MIDSSLKSLIPLSTNDFNHFVTSSTEDPGVWKIVLRISIISSVENKIFSEIWKVKFEFWFKSFLIEISYSLEMIFSKFCLSLKTSFAKFLKWFFALVS